MLGILAGDAAAGEALVNALAEDLASGAQLFADGLGLADQGFQDAILGPLIIDEVATGNEFGRLQFAIDAAVTLFEASRVPWHVEMD